MMRLKSITHVIYDMDGVLLDTECYYTQVTRTIAGRYGKVFDWSLKSKMIGRKAGDSAEILTKSLRLPLTPDQYLEERGRLLEKLFPMAEPMPGATALTRHLHRHGIPQAVATSSVHHYFELKTSRHKQWFGIFDCFVLGDDPEVEHGKPAPDIFLVAAKRLQALPSQCLVFEDSPAGVESALAAGMSVIAVPDPNMNHEEYSGSAAILRTLREFDPALWGLPPFSPGSGS